MSSFVGKSVGRLICLVLQGAAAVGVKSKTHAVVAAVKVVPNISCSSATQKMLLFVQRASSELSAYQKKIHPIDDHVGIALAGLASDGRLLRLVDIFKFRKGHPSSIALTFDE